MDFTNLTAGQDIVDSSGQSVGHVERVVLNPRTKKLSHFVIGKGLLSKDRVVPIQLVQSATDEQITLRISAAEVDELPHFEERHFVRLTDDEQAYTPSTGVGAQPMYPYPPAFTTLGSYPATLGYATQPFAVEVEENIPEETIALKEGAKVHTSDGKHVGDVEEILYNSDTDKATHLVIKEGLLFTSKRLIPFDWIRSAGDEDVYLTVSSRQVDSLPDYQAS